MNNQGFTYLEMLLVLLIVGAMSFFININFITTSHQIDLFNITNQFVSDYQYLKYYSLANHQQSKITFSSNCYYVNDNLANCPDNLEIENNFNDQITISKNGNINQAGTVIFNIGSLEKSVIFSIGKGGWRFE